ncbi:MAG TPA: hypothetical protein PLZ86_09285, partial [bacterium]|nr:hypothetical protein [bacterium]
MAVAAALFAAALLSVLFVPAGASAYPSEEVVGSGGGDPPFDIGVTGTVTGFLLFTDERMAVSFGETLLLFNVGRYEAEAEQPPPLSSDDETDGRITAIAHDSAGNRIIASQEDGDLLIFELSDITAEPLTFTVADGAELGPLAIDEARGVVYVADNTNGSIRVVDVATETVTNTFALPKTEAVCTDAFFNELTDEAWFSTDAGAVVYIPAEATTATAIFVDPTLDPGRTFNLAAMAPFADGRYIYVLNVHSADPSVYRIDAVGKEVITGAGLPVEITDNPDQTDIVATRVVNPDATYAYVAGANGVT